MLSIKYRLCCTLALIIAPCDTLFAGKFIFTYQGNEFMQANIPGSSFPEPVTAQFVLGNVPEDKVKLVPGSPSGFLITDEELRRYLLELLTFEGGTISSGNISLPLTRVIDVTLSSGVGAGYTPAFAFGWGFASNHADTSVSISSAAYGDTLSVGRNPPDHLDANPYTVFTTYTGTYNTQHFTPNRGTLNVEYLPTAPPEHIVVYLAFDEEVPWGYRKIGGFDIYSESSEVKIPSASVANQEAIATRLDDIFTESGIDNVRFVT